MMKNTAELKEESLVPANLQLFSRCRRITLPFVSQQNRLPHGDDAEGETSRTTDLPSVVYNPTPLRWYCPPEHFVDDLDLLMADQINSQVAVAAIPPVLEDDDELDTTLRLSNYSPPDSEKKRENNPTPDLAWFRPGFFDGVEDDEVDTALCFGPPAPTNPKKSRTKAKRKRKAADGDGDVNVVVQRNRRAKRNRNRDDEDQRPLLPIEQIPKLVNAIESRNGSTPIFLLRKVLEEADVKKDQNRLFFTKDKRLRGFLTEEEAAVVDDVDTGTRLKIEGVDGEGNGYDNFGMTKWGSVKMIVIISDWNKLVNANNAIKGDVVEIWGFRVDDKPCLAFNFRRENAASSGTSSSDEGTSSQLKSN